MPDSQSRPLSARSTRLVLAAVALLAAGCAGFQAANVPIEEIDPDSGYRLQVNRAEGTGRVWLFLAFSGGGTRAAAYAYGVLEGLRDTEVEIEGQQLSLLQEIDSISSVSGGSFTAAYYGLFGERIFEDFEQRFLKRDIQSALVWRILRPWNLLRLIGPTLTRTMIAMRLYHEELFERATFSDLAATPGPNLFINATDLTHGNRIAFNQDAFDLICSDLAPFPVAGAVAASSAVPGLLSPLTLRNHAGQCGFEMPPWAQEALESRRSNPRGYRAARSFEVYTDPERKRFIHLIDGAIADNLGLRVPIDRISAMGSARRLAKEQGAKPPDHLLLVSVNAENEPNPAFDLSYAAPSLAASLSLVSASQIRNFNFETLQLARSSVELWARQLSEGGHQVTANFVEVSFDLVDDDEERDRLKQLPTSFRLKDEEVEILKAAGRDGLMSAPAFRRFLGRLGESQAD